MGSAPPAPELPQPEEHWLARFLTVMLWTFAGLTIMSFLWALVDGRLAWAIATGLMCLAYIGVLFSVLIQLRRGQVAPAVLKVVLAAYAIVIASVLVVPTALPALIVVPVAAVALALPHLRPAIIQRLMLVGLAVTALLVLFAEHVQLFASIPAINSVPLLIFVLAEVALLYGQLWRYRARLSALLLRAQESNAALQQIQGGLEAEVRTRTAELAVNEARYRAILELTTDYVYTAQVGPGERLSIEWVSDAVSTVTGYTRAELVALDGWHRLIHPDDIAIVRERVATLIAGRSDIREFRIITKDGETRWLRDYMRPYQLDAQSSPMIAVLGAAQDITDRRHTQAKLGLINQQLIERVAELQRHTHELSLLNELNELLRACLTPEEAYAVIAATMQRCFPDEPGMLAIVDGEQQEFRCMAAWGQRINGDTFGRDDCWALRGGRPYRVDSAEQRLRCAHLANLQGYSICVPLMARGETLGVLTLANPTHDRINEVHWRLTITIARQIELALANLRLQERLRNQSIRDPLTDLFNRRYMEETLEREVSRAKRHGHYIGVIMLDIDHFKYFNDNYGHIAGDMLLRETGSFLQQHIRGGDIVCRYGGEEFTVIMPETTAAAMIQRAEELRLGIKQLELRYRGQQLEPVTISAGIALLPFHSDTANGVLAAADAALYKAKRSGRDCVMLAERPMLPAGELGWQTTVDEGA